MCSLSDLGRASALKGPLDPTAAMHTCMHVPSTCQCQLLPDMPPRPSPAGLGFEEEMVGLI